MANRKISDLTSLTAPATGDLLPIVDISEAAAADKNKKITYGELLASAPLGSAAAPSIAFEGDNTGIFSPGADQVAISTNGAQRVTIDSSGRLLVGTSSTPPAIETITPGLVRSGASSSLDEYSAGLYCYRNAGGSGRQTVAPRLFFARSRSGVNNATGGVVLANEDLGNIRFAGDDGTNFITAAEILAEVDGTPGTNDMPGRLVFSTTADGAASPTERMRIRSDGGIGIGGSGSASSALEINAAAATSPFIAKINNAEVARIDSSGRLLVGLSSAVSVNGITAGLELHAATTNGAAASIAHFNNDDSGPQLNFGKSRSVTLSPGGIVQNNDELGEITFCGDDGTDITSIAASISCGVDGTPGVNDMPGRLVFSTTADGASSPTARLRITSAGVLQVADAGDISVGTTTGTKIGTATTQKLGFYNATPVVQPTAVANATTSVDVITQLNALLAKLRTLGIIAT
jgi:hypothetical protein